MLMHPKDVRGERAGKTKSRRASGINARRAVFNSRMMTISARTMTLRAHALIFASSFFGSRRVAFALLVICSAIFASACAGSRPVDANAPRPTNNAAPPYPLTLADSNDRRSRTLAAWQTLTAAQGVTNAPPPQLQPVTETLRELPASFGANEALHLPVVVTDANANVSQRILELRKTSDKLESLRRFLDSASGALGVAPRDWSLIALETPPNGASVARYEQRSFNYPLRGGYGKLEIAFTQDNRILSIKNTAIPDAEQLNKSINALRPTVTADEAAAKINQPTDPKTRTLVILPIPQSSNSNALELHLAWELTISGAGAQRTYIDAVTGETLPSS